MAGKKGMLMPGSKSRMTVKRRNYTRGTARERTRDSIDTRKIVECLEKHALGLQEMKSTQIKAAQVLLDRTMPTLSSSEITEIVHDRDPQELMASLERVLPPEMIAILRAKFMPEHTAPDQLQ